jgi:hypothetical protein
MVLRAYRVLTLALVAFAPFGALAEEEQYTFKVLNKTDSMITELLVSEDGKTWGNFDLGGGVAAGSESTMAWDKSTNDESCEQQVKARYKDGSESEAKQFDFCDEGLELEFS